MVECSSLFAPDFLFWSDLSNWLNVIANRELENCNPSRWTLHGFDFRPVFRKSLLVDRSSVVISSANLLGPSHPHPEPPNAKDVDRLSPSFWLLSAPPFWGSRLPKIWNESNFMKIVGTPGNSRLARFQSISTAVPTCTYFLFRIVRMLISLPRCSLVEYSGLFFRVFYDCRELTVLPSSALKFSIWNFYFPFQRLFSRMNKSTLLASEYQ